METKIKLAERWMTLGYQNEASFMSDVCDQIAWGRNAILKIHAERLDAMLGIDQKKDTEGK